MYPGDYLYICSSLSCLVIEYKLFLIQRDMESIREGWDEAFALYAKEGEDKLLLYFASPLFT